MNILRAIVVINVIGMMLSGTGCSNMISSMERFGIPFLPSFSGFFDIAVQAVYTDGTSTDRQSLNISGFVTVDLTTTGSVGPGSNCDILLFEDKNGNGIFDSDQDTVLGARNGCLLPAEGQVASFDIPVNGTVEFAGNIIYAFADSSNVIPEPDETNNIARNVTAGSSGPSVSGINPVVEWAWTGGTINPSSNQLMSTPLVVNLNDDNGDRVIDDKDVPDILFTTFQGSQYMQSGTLRAVSGDGSGELFTIAGQNISPSCSMAVGDIDNDGLPEIIGIAGIVAPEYVCCLEHDGTFKWFSSQGGFSPRTILSIADIDGDGTPEILAGNRVLNNDGTVRWTGASPNTLGFSHAIDLDMDGIPEIISGYTAYRNTGAAYWEMPGLNSAFSSIANLDDDEYPEVIMTSSNGTNTCVYCLEYNGVVKWGPVVFPKGPEVPPVVSYRGGGCPPLVANVDGQGYPEIVIANQDRIRVLNNDGSIRWEHVTKDYSSGYAGCTAMDLDGDGVVEIAYADEQYFRIFNGSTGALRYQMEVGNGTLFETPVIADVDNDGQAEIVVSANDYAYNYGHHGFIVYGDANRSWRNTTKIWNQNAYHIDNVDQTGIIPAREGNFWLTHNSYRQSPIYQWPSGCELTASYLRLDTTSYPSFCTVTVRVGNRGPVDLSTGILIAFYNGDPAAGGTYLGRVPCYTELSPGEYVDVAFKWESPPAGTRNIYASVDDDGQGRSRIYENDESDNVLGFSFSIP